MASSNFAQINLDIFKGTHTGSILWQPRLEFWYQVNKARGSLPAHLKNASLLDLYDYVHGSIRYFTFPLKSRYSKVHFREERVDEKTVARTAVTPIGELHEALHYDEWNISRYNHEYFLKTPEDFRVYEYLLQDEEWYFDQEQYERDLAWVDGRGAPQFFFRRSPVQGLFIETMGFERAIFMLADHPEVVERYIEQAAAADNAMYDVLCKSPTPIFNFGENIDANMDPPSIWKRYLLPYYTRRIEQFHAAGKYTYIHIDGAMKPLVKLIPSSPFDAIEACTPLPQGDVTLEEVHSALGNKILVDGIPAVYFLPYYSQDELRACVERVVELFYPRLILGISDEIPPDGDIERVRMVGEWIEHLVPA